MARFLILGGWGVGGQGLQYKYKRLVKQVRFGRWFASLLAHVYLIFLPCQITSYILPYYT